MSCRTKEITLKPPGQMNTRAPDGGVPGDTARIIFNYVGGRRMGGLRVWGRRDLTTFLNQDLHDQLLGSIGVGGYVVASGPPVIITQPVPTATGMHGSAVLWVYSTGAPTLTYQWYDEGGAIIGATTSVLHLNDVTDPGTYWVIVTNGEGSVESDHVDVVIGNWEDILNRYHACFDTVADMLASNPAQWVNAECKNYLPGDRYLSMWVKTCDVGRLPNGTDILQTNGPTNPGQTVVRIYVREADSGTVTLPEITPYTVTVPVTAPTVEDLRNSFYSADLVFIGDPENSIVFRRGNSNTLDDGENGVLNQAGVHYDRIRFV